MESQPSNIKEKVRIKL